jgi:hypothetical protein
MITQHSIEQLTKRTREQMTALSVTRLSIGLQTVVHISYSDFIDAFASETTTYRLGMQIRMDVNEITYSADIVNGGTTVEKNCEE